MSTAPSTALKVTDLVPATVRRGWAAAGHYPDADLYTLFSRNAERFPGRAAVVDADGRITYAELDVVVRRLATALRALGVRTGDVVGVQLPNSRLSCALDLAVAAVGAVVLPFPVGRGDREAVSLLGRSRAVGVVTVGGADGCAHTATARAADLPELHTVVVFGDRVPPRCVPGSLLLTVDAEEFSPSRSDPDGPARILVSSGSEAEPKMVLYSHNALAGGRGRFVTEIRGDDCEMRSQFLVPLATAFGSNATAATIAANAGTVLVQPRFDPGGSLRMIERERPTHLLGVPTMLRKMLDHPGFDATDTSSVRVVVLGGSALDPRTASELRERVGCVVVNLYGSADGVNCHSALTDPPGLTAGVGRPNPAVARIRIIDEDQREVSAGETGEIIALGPMTPMSYVAAPELDRRYRMAGGWVRTGDLGRIDGNGCLHVVGRRKDVVIRGGLNISPAEVEAVLIEHPAIQDVACVAVTDPVLGERLCACVASSAPLRLTDIVAHLRAAGLETRKFPEHLVLLPALPLGAAGKVDRRLLAELAARREPTERGSA